MSQAKREMLAWSFVALVPWIAALLLIALSLTLACSTAQQTVINAADVVNQVARKGDKLDQVTVDACHAAEKVAVELPDVAQAEAKVLEIRKHCDAAFKAVDELDTAIKQVDAVFEAVERGDATVQDLVNSAMVARQLFAKAQQAHEALRAFLEKNT